MFTGRAARGFIGGAALVASLATAACGEDRPPLRLATTTSVRDSGLLDVLLPAFGARTGVEVSYVAVGTGLALDLGRRGEVDAVVTHDRAREEEFVRSGHGTARKPFATSGFAIVGPAADPAGIRGAGAAEAFRRIAGIRAVFASRGDSSGTHARELQLWREAGLVPPAGPAYVEVRAGMRATLQFASDRGAYTLTDRATFLAHREDLELERLVQGDPRLENVYAVVVVDPEKHPGADAERASRFAEWLVSDEARSLIGGLRRGGEPLFDVPVEGPLAVSAAISLKDVLQELATAFEAAGGAEVALNLAASGELERQIGAGSEADVFLSAGAPNVDALERRDAVEPATRRDVACNRLVVAVPRDAPAPAGLAALATLRRIAIGDPKLVPAGAYAEAALRSAGLWDRLKPVLVPVANVRQAVDYVARGEVDAAFVYVTDLAPASGGRVAFEVDPARHPPIAYPGIVLASSARKPLARSFLEFLASDAGRRAFARHGFGLPPCGGGESPR